MVTILPQLEPITFDRVKTIQTLPSDQTRRKCFEGHSGLQLAKKSGSTPSFSVNFKESIKPIYEAMTGLELKFSDKHKNYWHPVKKEDLEKVQRWESAQGCRVFIRDNLSLSIALGMYSTDPSEKHATAIGKLVYQAKYEGNIAAIKELVSRCVETIKSLPYYRKATCLCAVPPHPSKIKIDLPSIVAAAVADELHVQKKTNSFKYLGNKPQLKGLSLNDKWPALEAARLDYRGDSLHGNKIILIDDLYQSGITMQFIAMKLQQAGAHHVYGLSLAKNLGDKDNK